jgi:hypothetical protein
MKIWPVLNAYYIEIIANSFYALGKMGIYSQRWNMIWINGIWIKTQYENIISSQNKEKLAIIIMQLALKQLDDTSRVAAELYWYLFQEEVEVTVHLINEGSYST